LNPTSRFDFETDQGIEYLLQAEGTGFILEKEALYCPPLNHNR